MSACLITVGVLNWNGREYIERCLEAINRQTLLAIELVIVDNGSTDGSAALLKAYQFRSGIRYRLIALSENSGVAGGRTHIIAAATTDLIGFLDIDACAKPDWAQTAVDLMEGRPQVGLVASIVLFPNGRVNGFGAELDRYGHGLDSFWGQQADSIPDETTEHTAYPMGCGMVVRTSLAKQLCLDGAPVKWHDDSEIGIQAAALGYQVIRRRELVVVHWKGQSDKELPNVAYMSERARIRLVLKYYRWGLVWATGCGVLWSAIRSARKPATTVALIHAIGWNIRGLWSALQFRRVWRKKLRDVDLWGS